MLAQRAVRAGAARAPGWRAGWPGRRGAAPAARPSGWHLCWRACRPAGTPPAEPANKNNNNWLNTCPSTHAQPTLPSHPKCHQTLSGFCRMMSGQASQGNFPPSGWPAGPEAGSPQGQCCWPAASTQKGRGARSSQPACAHTLPFSSSSFTGALSSLSAAQLPFSGSDIALVGSHAPPISISFGIVTCQVTRIGAACCLQTRTSRISNTW